MDELDTKGTGPVAHLSTATTRSAHRAHLVVALLTLVCVAGAALVVWVFSRGS